MKQTREKGGRTYIVLEQGSQIASQQLRLHLPCDREVVWEVKDGPTVAAVHDRSQAGTLRQLKDKRAVDHVVGDLSRSIVVQRHLMIP